MEIQYGRGAAQGETTVIEQVPNERRVTRAKVVLSALGLSPLSLTMAARSSPSNIEYTIPVPVLGKLAEKLVLKRNERETETALENVKDKMEV